MKKVFFLFLATIFCGTLFSQVSSEKLLKERKKEIEGLEKAFKKTKRGVENDPKEKEILLARVDSFYLPLVRAAMERESALPGPVVKTEEKVAKTDSILYNKNGKSTTYDQEGRVVTVTELSSEPQKRTPEPEPVSRGSKISYQGDQGAFSANSTWTRRGAEAYATVAMADANASLIRQLAKGQGATMTAPNNSVGLEGVIVNKYRYHEIEVKITGISSSNAFYNKTFLVGKEQSVTDYLLPGAYQVTVRKLGSEKIWTNTFSVNPSKTHSANGRSVFWWISYGTDW